MLNKDYYKILELNPDITQEEIKDQYRLLLHAWHPDKFPNPQQKLRAQERLKEINEAYATLSSPESRTRYDALRKQEQAKQEEYSRRAEYERLRREQDEAESQRIEEERQEEVKKRAERVGQGPVRSHQTAGFAKEETVDSIPLDFPVHCQGCGVSDSSLRWSIFPY